MTYSLRDVLGQSVRPETDLVLHHEHLYCDATCWLQPSEDPKTHGPVEDADIDDVRRRPWSYADNLRLGDALVRAEVELMASRSPVIIDVTPDDIGRSPEGLRTFAKSSKAQVFMGSGRYVEGARAGETMRDPAFYRDEILHDLLEGIDGVKAAVIGEIGTSTPVTDLEDVSLRGAAQAQASTGAPLFVHVDGWNPLAHEVLDVVEAEGADIAKTLVCHMDWCIVTRGLAYIAGVLERGPYIAFDTWGDELAYGGNQQPSDDERVDALLELTDRGYGDRILHSNDITTKTQLNRFGGPGYVHIPGVIFPKLREKGLSPADIDALFLEPAVSLLSEN